MWQASYLRRWSSVSSLGPDLLVGRSRESNPYVGLERADRKIAQPQVGEAALVPDPEQRPIEREPHHVVAFAYRDADAAAEIAIVEIGAATEHAAVLRRGAVEPERQRDGVAEQQVDVAAPQREPRQ